MGNRQNESNYDEAILRTMREMILEAPAAEMESLAREFGSEVEKLSEKGAGAIGKAIARFQSAASMDESVTVLHKGLNSLLTMLRRRDNIDEVELAFKANVDESEIRRIEYDATYLPSPRTIYNLEKAFSLPSGVLAKLSGAIRHHSSIMEERVLAFAANAKQIGKLTREERQLLTAFLQFLSEQD